VPGAKTAPGNGWYSPSQSTLIAITTAPSSNRSSAPAKKRTVAGRLLGSFLVVLAAFAVTVGWTFFALRAAARDAELLRSVYVPMSFHIGEALASFRGKVVIGVAKRTKAANIPLIAIVGDIGDDISPVYDMGVSAIFSINRVAIDFKEAKLRSKSDLKLTMDNLVRFIKRITF
jgi:hypothetical protein